MDILKRFSNSTEEISVSQTNLVTSFHVQKNKKKYVHLKYIGNKNKNE